ncbi:ABC transporter permease [Streptomyces sp. NPDC057580]|uniref:ABC transporter permease n=1 Tax=Streptomyces sp. NPDC057580 TaxID=3346173 RepID=UPI0036C41172
MVMHRLARMVPLVFLVSVAVFGLVHLIPGDPAVTLAGDNPTPEQVESIRTALGLDRPVVIQYVDWLRHVLQGDLGASLYQRTPVVEGIAGRLPITLSLTLAAMVVALVIGVPAGVVAASRRGSWIDRAVTVLTTIGIAVPSFWLGLVLIVVFSLQLQWFPAVGYTHFTEGPAMWLWQITLPAITLGVHGAAELARHTRSAMHDALGQDYVRTARAQGLPGGRVLAKHALKNAGVPVLTIAGFQFSILMGGAVIVEQIFGIPGLGSLAIDAVIQKDLPVIQGVVLVAALIVMLTNLLVDLAYGYLNPKVRAS